MLNYDEKRNFQRMDARCKIQCILPGSQQVIEGTTQDISAVGIRFEIDQALSEDQELEVLVEGGTTATPPLRALIRVQRVMADPGGAGFVVASSISKMLE
ncbi:MAG: PilZ domain-containing protein [Chromatiales bacterium]|nr:PilZ domain-containing protein [Chromatiales bacterium]